MPSILRDDEPIAFQDHISRTRNGIASGKPYPLSYDVTYVVAAQDIFGRWSDWEKVAFTQPDGGPAGAEPSFPSSWTMPAASSVDFSWDWADRSPAFIELSGAWLDQPGNVLASAQVDFSGQDQGQTGGEHSPAVDREGCPRAGA